VSAATTIPRKAGVEVVRRELSRGASGQAIPTPADVLLAEAERLYTAHAAAPMVPGVESLPWSECCTDTVRRWVAVAREARRMHGSGR
jgi:hypothetical protein